MKRRSQWAALLFSLHKIENSVDSLYGIAALSCIALCTARESNKSFQQIGIFSHFMRSVLKKKHDSLPLRNLGNLPNSLRHVLESNDPCRFRGFQCELCIQVPWQHNRLQ